MAKDKDLHSADLSLPQSIESDNEITIVFVGRIGAGKSSLRNNILEENKQEELSVNSVTKNNNFEVAKKNGKVLKIYDTVGLTENSKENEQILYRLAESTEKLADLIVLCIPVHPGARFFGMPGVMLALQKAYGMEIWKHCIIAFTFSNLAWDRCEKQNKDKKSKDKAIANYIRYIREYADKVQQQMQQEMGMPSVIMRTPFDQQPPLEQGQLCITAVPVGDEDDDNVLPNIKLAETDKNWKGFFFLQMIESCPQPKRNALLKYRYSSTQAVRDVLKVMGITSLTTSGTTALGAGIGMATGALAGLPGGPIGMAIGAATMGIAGAIVGTAAGAGLSVAAVDAISKSLD